MCPQTPLNPKPDFVHVQYQLPSFDVKYMEFVETKFVWREETPGPNL